MLSAKEKKCHIFFSNGGSIYERILRKPLSFDQQHSLMCFKIKEVIMAKTKASHQHSAVCGATLLKENSQNAHLHNWFFSSLNESTLFHHVGVVGLLHFDMKCGGSQEKVALFSTMIKIINLVIVRKPCGLKALCQLSW